MLGLDGMIWVAFVGWGLWYPDAPGLDLWLGWQKSPSFNRCWQVYVGLVLCYGREDCYFQVSQDKDVCKVLLEGQRLLQLQV